MDKRTILDYAIFQLTPTRTRYELYVVSRGVTERMASGLLKPFLSHVQAAEDQLAKGGYSIKLEHPVHSKAPWFTKGTIERFVRFVSSPEVIERGHIIETELLQLEETIRLQTSNSTRGEDPQLDGSLSICLLGDESFSTSRKFRALKKMRQDVAEEDSSVSQNSKKQLLRALEARRLVLHKEQGMAFARAAAAGFDLVPLLQLIMFSECFGASRLREACCKFVALCKKRQIVGFCIGDLNLINEDISWSFSNFACVNMLKSMEKILHSEGKTGVDNVQLSITGSTPVVQEQTLFDEAISSEKPSLKLLPEQQLPALPANLSPSSQSLDWLNTRAVCQGWPIVFPDRNGPAATFNGYHYGYSPGSQQSCTTPSDVSPLATGLTCYSMGVMNQPQKAICKTFPSQDINAFPSLRKLQVGHKGKKGSRRARDAWSNEPCKVEHEKDSSCETTDSSFETSESSRETSVVFHSNLGSGSSVKGSMKQGLAGRADLIHSADFIAESKVPPFKGDASMFLMGEKDSSDVNGGFYPHQMYETTSNVQASVAEFSDDKSLLLLEQCRGDTMGSKSKKRLNFQESEFYSKQAASGDVRLRDDSLHACETPGTRECRVNPTIESEVQANQIYHKMSKQALKANSVVFTRNGPDDSQLLPRERIHNSSRNSSDVLNIEIELRGSAGCPSHLKSQEIACVSQPNQDRVINFLSQYNEKREAKLRANAHSLNKAERERKLTAMKEDLDKKKSDLVKSTRSERARLQSEAQLRAEKLRMYKADLLKSKKEKEAEERQRLEELKTQRQSRIAARSNLITPSNASSWNVSRQMSSESSNTKLWSASRPAALQKNSISVRDSHSRLSSSQTAQQRLREHALRSSTKATVAQHLRSCSPSEVRQTRKTGIGSQRVLKREALKSPQKSTSPIKVNRMPVASNRDMQLGRLPSIRRKDNSTTITEKQGVFSGLQSGLPLDKSQKKLPSKETPDIMDETKAAKRTFLKKGSGRGAATSCCQKMNSASPLTVRSTDRRFLGTPTTQVSRPTSKQSNGSMVSFGATRVATSRGSIMKSRTSLPTQAVNSGSARASFKPKPEAHLTKTKPVLAKVHSDSKLKASLRGVMLQPGACSALENNCLALQRSASKGSLEDCVMPRPFFSDSCTMNEDRTMHSAEMKGGDRRLTASTAYFLDPQSRNVVGFHQNSCDVQSQGSQKLSSFGHTSSRMSPNGQMRSVLHEGKHLASKAPSNGQLLSGTSSSKFKESSQTSIPLPIPFLKATRNKVAEQKCHS